MKFLAIYTNISTILFVCHDTKMYFNLWSFQKKRELLCQELHFSAFFLKVNSSVQWLKGNKISLSTDQQTLRKFAEKTNFNLRLSEIVRQTSCISNLIVMTLPVPKKDNLPSALYMSLLDFMTRDMPPFLLVRGNQESVLTFYS